MKIKRNPRMTPVMKLASVLVCFNLLFSQALLAGNLPTGGSVVHGNVSIDTIGNNMQINQGTGQAIINWESFNIGAGFGVYVNQPTAQAAMLSRITGADPSQIFGILQANGIFYLVNPNGVFFGANASVDAAQFIASTLNISNNDFLAGNIKFTGDSNAAIENHGQIRADLVALIAKDVTHSGVIAANQVAIAAAQSVELGRIAGGKLSVNMSGLMGDAVVADGVIDASEFAQGQTGGDVVVAGGRVGVFGNSVIEASGDAGGGSIRIGGDFQGADTVTASTTTQVGQDAVIKADAVTDGDGGKVIVWSDGYTLFYGDISARGGAEAGNGGFAEVSGLDRLAFAGGVDLSATAGSVGSLLLDPNDLIVADGGDADLAGTGNTDAQIAEFAETSDIAADPWTIDADAVVNAMLAADVQLQANNTITINEVITSASGNDLTLTATTGNIDINQNIALNGALTITAGGSINGPGDILLNLGNQVVTLTANGIGNISSVDITNTGAFTGGNSLVLTNTGPNSVNITEGANIEINTVNITQQDALSNMSIDLRDFGGSPNQITVTGGVTPTLVVDMQGGITVNTSYTLDTAGVSDLNVDNVSYASPGSISITAADANANITVQNLGITTTNRNVSLTSDNLAITAAISTGAGNINIAPYTAGTDMYLGTAGGAGTLSLTSAEVNLISTAGTLAFGGANTDAIYVNALATDADITGLVTMTATAAGGDVFFQTADSTFTGANTTSLTVTAADQIQFNNSVDLTVANNITLTAAELNLGGSGAWPDTIIRSSQGGKIQVDTPIDFDRANQQSLRLQSDGGEVEINQPVGNSGDPSWDWTLYIVADTFDLNAAVTTSGNASIQANTIDLAGGTWQNNQNNFMTLMPYTTTDNYTWNLDSGSLDNISGFTGAAPNGLRIGSVDYGTDIVVSNALNLTDMTLTFNTHGANGGSVTLPSITDSYASGGINFTTTNGGYDVILNNNLVTQGGAINFGSVGTGANVILNNATVLIDTTNAGAAAAGGSVNFYGTIEESVAGASTLQLNAGTGGTVNVDGTVGAATDIDAFLVDSAGTVDIAAAVEANTTITLNTDNLTLAGALQAPTAITIAPVTAGRDMYVGATGGGVLDVSGAEVQLITTVGLLTFGGATAGDIHVTGLTAANTANITGNVTFDATADDSAVVFETAATDFGSLGTGKTLTVSADAGVYISQNLTVGSASGFGSIAINGDTDNAADAAGILDAVPYTGTFDDAVNIAEVSVTAQEGLTIDATTGGVRLTALAGTAISMTTDNDGDIVINDPINAAAAVNLTISAEGGVDVANTITIPVAGANGNVTITVDSNNNGVETLAVNNTISGNTITLQGVGGNDLIDINVDINAGGGLLVNTAATVTIDAAAARTLTAQNGNLDIATGIGQITLDGGAELVTITTTGGTGNISLANLVDSVGVGAAGAALRVFADPATTSGNITTGSIGAGGGNADLRFVELIADGNLTAGAITADSANGSGNGIFLSETGAGAIDLTGALTTQTNTGNIAISTDANIDLDQTITAAGMIQVGDTANAQITASPLSVNLTQVLTSAEQAGGHGEISILLTDDFSMTGSGRLVITDTDAVADDIINIEIAGGGVQTATLTLNSDNGVEIAGGTTTAVTISTLAGTDNAIVIGNGDVNQFNITGDSITITGAGTYTSNSDVVMVANPVLVRTTGAISEAGAISDAGSALATPPNENYGIAYLSAGNVTLQNTASLITTGANGNIIITSDADLTTVTGAGNDGTGDVSIVAGANVNAQNAASAIWIGGINVAVNGTVDADGSNTMNRAGGVINAPATTPFSVAILTDENITGAGLISGAGDIVITADFGFDAAFGGGLDQTYGTPLGGGDGTGTITYTGQIVAAGGLDITAPGAISISEDLQADWIRIRATGAAGDLTITQDGVNNRWMQAENVGPNYAIQLSAGQNLVIEEGVHIDADRANDADASTIGLGAAGTMTINGSVGTDQGLVNVEASSITIGGGGVLATPTSIAINNDGTPVQQFMLASDNITVSASNGMTITDLFDMVSTNGSINIDADSDNDGAGTFSMLGDSRLESGWAGVGTLTIDAGVINLNAANATAEAELRSGGTITLTTTGAAATSITIQNATNLATSNAAGDISIVANTTVDLTGTSTINSAGTNPGTSLNIQGTAVTLNSDSGATEITAAGDTTITATTGAASVGTAGVTDTDIDVAGALTITAATTADFNGGNVDADGALTIVGGTGVSSNTAQDGFGGSSISITATANDVNLDNDGGNVVADGTDLIIAAGNHVIINTNLSAVRDVILRADRDNSGAGDIQHVDGWMRSDSDINGLGGILMAGHNVYLDIAGDGISADGIVATGLVSNLDDPPRGNGDDNVGIAILAANNIEIYENITGDITGADAANIIINADANLTNLTNWAAPAAGVAGAVPNGFGSVTLGTGVAGTYGAAANIAIDTDGGIVVAAAQDITTVDDGALTVTLRADAPVDRSNAGDSYHTSAAVALLAGDNITGSNLTTVDTIGGTPVGDVILIADYDFAAAHAVSGAQLAISDRPTNDVGAINFDGAVNSGGDIWFQSPEAVTIPDNSTIDAIGDITYISTLNEVTLGNSVLVRAGLGATAPTGNITFTAATDVTLGDNNVLSAGTNNATGSVYLTAGGYGLDDAASPDVITIGNQTQLNAHGGSVVLSATDGTITSGTSTDMTATLDVVMTAEGAVSVDGSLAPGRFITVVTGETGTVTGGFTLGANGTIDLPTSLVIGPDGALSPGNSTIEIQKADGAAGDLITLAGIVNTDGDITVALDGNDQGGLALNTNLVLSGTLNATDNVSVTTAADRNITGNGYVNADQILVQAGGAGNIVLRDVTANEWLNLVSTTGNITTGNLTAGANNNYAGTLAAIKIDTAGNFTSTGNLTATAQSGLNIWIDPAVVSLNGDVTADGNIWANATGDFTINGAIHAYDSTAGANGNVYIYADDDGTNVTTGGALAGGDGAGNLTMLAGSSILAQGAVSLAGDGLTLYDVTAAGNAGAQNLTVTADNNNDGATLTLNGVLQGVNSATPAQGVLINANAANISVNADPNNTLGGLDVNGTGILTLAADLSAANNIDVAQAVTLAADSMVNANLANGGGTVTFQGAINSDAAGENVLFIDNATAAVSVQGIGAVTALDSITITGTAVTLNGALQADNLVSVTTAGANDIDIQNGMTALSGNIVLNSDQAIVNSGAGTLTAQNGTVSLLADTEITVNTDALFLQANTDAGAITIVETDGVSIAAGGITTGLAGGDDIALVTGGTINGIGAAFNGDTIAVQTNAGSILDMTANSQTSTDLISAQSIQGGSLTSAGTTNILAQDGDISGITVTSSGAITIEAQGVSGDILNSSLTSTADAVTVTSSRNIAGTDVVASSSAIVVADMDIVVGSFFGYFGAASLTANNGEIVGVQVQSNTEAGLTASRDITGFSVDSGRVEITATGTGNIVGGAVSSAAAGVGPGAEVIINTAAGSIDGLTINAVGEVEVVSANDISGLTLDAGALVDITANNDVLGGTVNGGDAVNVTATNGNIDGAAVVGVGIVTAIANQNIANASFTSTGASVDLTATTADLSGVSVLAATDATLIATAGNILGSTVNASGTATLQALAGNIVGNMVDPASVVISGIDVLGNVATATTDITITATGDATGNTLDSGGTVVINATLDASANLIDAEGQVDLTAGGDAVGNVIDGGADVNLITTGGDATDNTVDAVGNLLVNANANIVGGGLTADGTLDLLSVTGSISGVTANAAGTVGAITQAVSGDILNSSFSSTGSTVDLTAGRNISATDAFGLDSVTLIAGTGLIGGSSITGGTVFSFGGAASLTAAVGEIVGVEVQANTDASLSAGRDIVGVTVDAGSIFLSSTDTGNIVGGSLSSSSAAAGFRVVLNTNAGDVTGTVIDAVGNVQIAGAADVTGITIDTAGLVDIDANNSVQGGSVLAGGTADITATTGDIDGITVQGNGQVQLTATAGTISASSATSDAANVILGAGADITGTDVNAVTTAALTAANDIDSTSAIGGGTVTFVATAGSVTASSATSTGANVVMTTVGDDISGTDVSAATTAALTAANDIIGGSVDAVGNATLIATAGEINGTNVQTDTTAALTAALDITGVSVDAATSITVTAGGDLTGGAFDSALITVAAGVDNVVGNAFTTSGNLVVTADQDIVGNAVDAGGLVTLTATQDATGNIVDAVGNVTIVATQDAAGNVIDTAANAAITGVNVQGGSVLAAGTADITATTGDIDGIAVMAAGAVTALGNQSVTNSSFTSTGSTVGVTATTVDVTNTDVVANLGATVLANGDVIGSSVVSETAAVGITATTGSITATDVNAATTATLLANVDIVGGDVVSGTAASLTATTGEINGTNVQTDTTAALTAALDITGVSVDAATSITVTAGGDLTGGAFDSALITVAAGVDNVVGNAFTTSGAIGITADQDVTGNAVDAGGQVDITATGDASGNLIDGGAAVNVTATEDATGNIIDAVGTVTILATEDAAGNVIDTAANAAITGVNVQGGSVLAGGTAGITATTGDIDGIAVMAAGAVTALGNQSVTNSSFTSTTSTVGVTATNVDVTNTDVVANLGATVLANGDVIGSSVVSETAAVGITATTGSITGTDVNAATTAALLANVDIDSTSAIGGGTVTFVATAGSVSASSATSTGANVAITAGQDVVATDTLALTDIDYTVTRDVIGGTATAGDDITVSADGRTVNLQATTDGGDTITLQGIGGLAAGSVDGGVFTADTIVVNKATGVGANDAVRIAGAETITIDNSTSGGVNVVSTNNNATTIDVDALTLGDIVFDHNGDGALTVTNLNTGAGDIYLTSTAATTVNSITSGANGDVEVLVDNAALLVQGAGVNANGSGYVELTNTGDGNDITVNATVQSGTGPIAISAANDANLNALVTTAGGTISVTTLTGDINAESNIITVGGIVNLLAGDAILDTTDATTGITSATLNILGATSVGTDADADPTTNDNGWLDTNVGTLNAANVDGSAYVLEANDLVLGTVKVGLAHDEHLAVHAAGNIDLGLVEAAAGTVTLVAGVAINDAQVDTVTDITARVIDLDAVTGIGNTAPVELAGELITADTTNGDINLTNSTNVAAVVNTLTTGTGDIDFAQVGGGDVTFNAATTQVGDITLAADNGNLIAVTVTAGAAAVATGNGNVTLTTTTNGDVRVDNVTAASDTITITSIGDIDEQGADAAADLTSTFMVLNAVDGIGRNGALELQFAESAAGLDDASLVANTTGDNGAVALNSNNLTATDFVVTTIGEDADIDLNHAGGGFLTLTNVTTQNGDVRVTSAADISIINVDAFDDGLVNGVTDDAHIVDITATTGNILLGADAVRADYAVTLEATAGSILDNANDNTWKITSGGDVTLLVGNLIGEANYLGDPIEVDAAQDVYVGSVNGSPAFLGGPDGFIWAFLVGNSATGEIFYLNGGDAPGVINWNGQVWGGLEEPILDVLRIEAFEAFLPSLMAEIASFETYYFRQVTQAALPDAPPTLQIEMPLDGRGSINGTPQGYGPTRIDVRARENKFGYSWDQLMLQLEQDRIARAKRAEEAKAKKAAEQTK